MHCVMNKIIRNLLLAAAVVGTAIYGILWNRQDNHSREIYTVTKTNFQETILAYGHIDTRNYIPLRAPNSPIGRQIIYLFPEGQPVEEGEIVARFDASEVKEKIESLETEIIIHQTTIAEKIAEWDIRSEQLDTIILKLVEELKMADILLAGSQFDSQLQQDEEHVRHNGAKKNLSSLEKTRQRYAILRKEDTAYHDKKITKCYAEIAKQKALLKHYIIRAPFDTITRYPKIRITRIYRQPEPGDELVRLQEFGQLPNFNSKCLNLYIPEKHVESIEIGMALLFSTQSNPNTQLKGIVTSKSTFASVDNSRPGQPLYLVQADINPSQIDTPDLIPGANITAEIIIKIHPDVFPLPRDIVTTTNHTLIIRDEKGSSIPFDLTTLPRTANYILIPDDNHNTLTVFLEENNKP